MQKEAEKTVRVKTLLTWGLVVALVAVFLLWWQGDALRRALALPAADGTEPQTLVEPILGEQIEAQPGGPVAEILTGAVARWTEVAGTEPAWPSDFSVPQDCEAVEADLAKLCAAIDARAYVRGRVGGGGFCETLQQAGEELAGRPPSPSSELRSYSTMLENVFHLYRTLGKKRVELLRDVLNQEQATQELAAMTLYRWMVSRERCTEQRSKIALSAMYEYSAFLLQTMGGQAYLRRRGAHSEALATFYALLTLDQSIESNINPHGIDPRPELARCRGLLQSQPLVFRDRYVGILDEMAKRWEARSSR